MRACVEKVNVLGWNKSYNKNSMTPKLLRSSTIYPNQNTTIISKSDSGASKNYWSSEDIPYLTDITDISNGPTVQ